MTSEKVWTSQAWRDSAESWLDEQLASHGIRRTGELTQPRVRPWGTVLTAPTSAGVIWMKAPGPEAAFEVGLYEVLRDIAAEWVLEPIALDVERGWLVLPDGGPTVRHDPYESMLKVLPQYGELQRRLFPHVNRLLAAGVQDMRADVIPQRFDEAVATVRRRPHEPELVDEIVARRDVVVERAAQLAEMSIPPSVDHNDLHVGNVFLAGRRAKFYDWGDSVIAHPLASMLVVAQTMDVDEASMQRLRDSYLEAFSDLATHRELVEQLELACWVGIVARTLVWDRALGPNPARFASAPLETLSGIRVTQWAMRSGTASS
ncbi:aminoglycoside phosphotransferase family protein [Kibdelosporangium philippinense]|uniref:Aminoglycoside phosphotransferase family protein n=1 Tax=Kibdelosporangium philippinense TaxID=211113 RepID=A0ABS8Z3Q0_9PSEU|nr:phosphotransferase [Kibdelosporangium philippinense]MCE7002543.1 aminoglycoside phosphotransferase family protein [Kibdelosporangium philippinense]